MRTKQYLFSLILALASTSCLYSGENPTVSETPDSLFSAGTNYLQKLDYAKALECFNKAATNNCPKAQYALGVCYLKGQGLKQDTTKAMEWLTEASDSNDDLASLTLGDIYLENKDNDKAIKYYNRAADSRSIPQARQLDLARILGDHYFGLTNYAQAERHYLKAANDGTSDDKYRLAQFYFDQGKYTQSLEIFSQEDSPRFNFMLAFCHEKLNDNVRAAKWYKKAADQGHPQAQYNIGQCYELGRGMEKDPMLAVEYYSKAADQGIPEAQCSVGVFYEKMGDFPKAAEFYRKAADQGSPNAQYHLGVCYENGIGQEKDLLKAIEFYRKASDQGHDQAQKALNKIKDQVSQKYKN